MRKQALAVLAATTLLLSASDGTHAAGKMGGAAGGFEITGGSGPVFAGKLGGAGGADEFLLAEPEDVRSIAIVPGGKLGVAGGDD